MNFVMLRAMCHVRSFPTSVSILILGTKFMIHATFWFIDLNTDMSIKERVPLEEKRFQRKEGGEENWKLSLPKNI